MAKCLLNPRCIIRFVILLFVFGIGVMMIQPRIRELEAISQTQQKANSMARETKNNAKNVIKGENLTAHNNDDGLPMIYVITPTYTRLTQKADLVRLSQTLMLVKRLTWIVVEDANKTTELVSNLLKQTGLSYVHLHAPSVNNKTTRNKRGIIQRNKGLQWIREHTPPNDSNGVVYFGDDDNTYSIKLFEEMRCTKRISVWPVGLVGGTKWETPLVKNGKVVGFDVVYAPNRDFPLDMAAFAFNVKLLHEKPHAMFLYKFKEGWIEGDFLKSLGVTRADLEPKAKNCSVVYVWHTKTSARYSVEPKNYKGPQIEVRR